MRDFLLKALLAAVLCAPAPLMSACQRKPLGPEPSGARPGPMDLVARESGIENIHIVKDPAGCEYLATTVSGDENGYTAIEPRTMKVDGRREQICHETD